jgi:hypothetical protein
MHDDEAANRIVDDAPSPLPLVVLIPTAVSIHFIVHWEELDH